MNPAARTLCRPSFEARLGGEAFVRAMLDFESALARAQAEEGLIPAASAAAIERASRAPMDADQLVAEGKWSASVAVPFMAALRARVVREDADAAKHLHFGATSQDVIDTAMATCVRRCIDEGQQSLASAVAAFAAKAREHRDTPMLGRTLLQPALAITAGLKIARWTAALEGDRRRIAEARPALAIQLGGAVGTLEKMGAKGLAVRARVARSLDLADAPCWHAHRGAWIDLMDRVGQAIATIGKIARDVALLSQPEVGEMQEALPQPGIGASSAMAHKHNPVGCAHALAAAIRAPGLLATIHAGAIAEHERALGGWQAELAAVPDLLGAYGASLDFLDRTSVSLVIDAKRMAQNLRAHPEAGTIDGEWKDASRAALEELLGYCSSGKPT